MVLLSQALVSLVAQAEKDQRSLLDAEETVLKKTKEVEDVAHERDMARGRAQQLESTIEMLTSARTLVSRKHNGLVNTHIVPSGGTQAGNRVAAIRAGSCAKENRGHARGKPNAY